MKKLCLILIILVCACDNGEDNNQNEPKKIISKQKMSLIITDLMLAESYFQIKYSVLPRYKDALLLTADSIFSKHNTSSAEFDENYSYYLNNKEDLLEIYKASLDSLNLKHSQVGSKK